VALEASDDLDGAPFTGGRGGGSLRRDGGGSLEKETFCWGTGRDIAAKRSARLRVWVVLVVYWGMPAIVGGCKGG
jgi:hypothetical protein